MTSESLVTREFYAGFQRVEFNRWNPIIAEDVLINSPAGFGLRGLATLKEFAAQFTDLGYRVDLVDEHLALDEQGTGRGFITFVLHWKHTKDFGGLAPTRAGRGRRSRRSCSRSSRIRSFAWTSLTTRSISRCTSGSAAGRSLTTFGRSRWWWASTGGA